MIKKMRIDESTNIVDFKEIKNNDMANSVLKDFLEKEGISQAELARGIDKDKVTVNRWVNNIRDISVDDAEKVSEFLGVDALDLLYEKRKATIFYTTDKNFVLKDIRKEKKQAYVPREFWRKDIKTIQVDDPSIAFHNFILIWNGFNAETSKVSIPRVSSNGFNKICKITIDCKKIKLKIIGIPFVYPNGDFKILQPWVLKSFPEFDNLKLTIKDMTYCEPISCMFDGTYLNHK
jgi:transcriptional regulator with XRE-family HTH domain